MKRTMTLIPVGALVMVLSAISPVAATGQDREGRDRSGRHTEGQPRNRPADGRRGDAQPAERSADRAADRPVDRSAERPADRSADRGRAVSPDRPSVRADAGADRGTPRADVAPQRGTGRPDSAPDRGVASPVPAPGGRFGVPDRREADPGRGDARGSVAVPRRYDERREPDRRNDDRRNDDRWRDDRGLGARGDRDAYRDDRYRNYGGPRLVVPVRPAPHYYGSGGRFSVYFGLGSGYLFGTPYSGRVYGYLAPRSYGGARVYYGDVRLMVRPRDAAVYVDGYYAGVVDDFDGVFQRLTLEVGPHQIELSAPGMEPQFYDVYVDPAQTVTIRSDLYRD